MKWIEEKKNPVLFLCVSINVMKIRHNVLVQRNRVFIGSVRQYQANDRNILIIQFTGHVYTHTSRAANVHKFLLSISVS
jgi:hypothetical protein